MAENEINTNTISQTPLTEGISNSETDNDDISKKLQHAGDAIGERMWQLPLWDAWRSDIESDIADIKNWNGDIVVVFAPVASSLDSMMRFLSHSECVFCSSKRRKNVERMSKEFFLRFDVVSFSLRGR